MYSEYLPIISLYMYESLKYLLNAKGQLNAFLPQKSPKMTEKNIMYNKFNYR